LLYDELYRVQPTAIVALNRIVAVAMDQGPAMGLGLLDDLAVEADLDSYAPYHVTRAALSRQAGDLEMAAQSYQHALDLTHNATERRFLERQLAEIAG